MSHVSVSRAATEPGRRRTRANGEESRAKILEAATAIAAERGYEGTSIALVSERSGLPASSIYWHFKDKDALFAAVIERSFGEWLGGASLWGPSADGTSRAEHLQAMLQRTARALVESGDFLRLGLMLALERRPDELSARRMFLQVRGEAYLRTVSAFARLFPELDDDAVRQLATFTMAMADGLFVAHEISGESVDIVGQFETLAAAVLGAAEQLTSRSEHSRNAPE
jgi:AcrR family transcriptional regulator